MIKKRQIYVNIVNVIYIIYEIQDFMHCRKYHITLSVIPTQFEDGQAFGKRWEHWAALTYVIILILLIQKYALSVIHTQFEDG